MSVELLKKPKGGAREGAGRKVGGKNESTLTKEALREVYKALVIPRLAAIANAQLDSAIGINHFMLRDPETGQFSRITDPDQILAALNAPPDEAGSRYMIYAKDPNQQAATDVLNRLMDKPKEQEQSLDVNAKLVISWEQ